MDTAANFEQFVLLCRDTVGDGFVHRDQTSYLVDENGNTLVEFIGRFENLEKDFLHAAAMVARPAERLDNVNPSGHAHYSTFYTAESRDAVARSFARDIARFGYDFEDRRRLSKSVGWRAS